MQSIAPLGPANPHYRPDIDGLRAVAVLSVLIFHVFPGVLGGGFIGVDVFFVISGYLISTDIFQNLDRNTFSFVDFYARRIRRIFPALLLVLTASFAFGWLALLPDEYKLLSKHISAGAGFVSNVVLTLEQGYFDTSAETKPLLHLWSLGVEEQFYVVWPALLFAAKCRKVSILSIAVVMAVTSFCLNAKWIYSDPVSTFYSTPTRFWELLCGSILAWVTRYKTGIPALAQLKKTQPVRSVRTDNLAIRSDLLFSALSIVGLALLVYGFFLIDKASRFPGKLAAIPVLASVLIICAGPNALVNRTILSSKIAVWFGLISYPLYLWHWPIFSFITIVNSEPPGTVIGLASVAFSIVLAWITYELVERRVRFASRGNRIAAMLAALMAVVGCISYGAFRREGLTFRQSPVNWIYAGDIGNDEYFVFWSQKYVPCTNRKILNSALTYGRHVRCLQSHKTDDVDLALIGDSHAEQLFMGLARSMPEQNLAYYIRSALPLVTDPNFNDIFNEVIESKSTKRVILAALWSRRVGELSADADFETQLTATIDALERGGKVVYLTDNIPMFPFPPNSCAQRRRFSTNVAKCDVSRADAIEKSKAYKAVLSNILAKRKNVRLIEVEKYICEDDTCRMVREGKLLYRDNRHLSINGSIYIGDVLARDYGKELAKDVQEQ